MAINGGYAVENLYFTKTRWLLMGVPKERNRGSRSPNFLRGGPQDWSKNIVKFLKKGIPLHLQ